MSNYEMNISTISPLFIGSGEELRLNFDFVNGKNQTGRLDVNRIYEDRYDEKNPDIPPGKILRDADYSNPAYFRYIIPGNTRTQKTDGKLQACVKDVHDCPYIPGSSIKGAIRTAIACQIVRDNAIDLKREISMDKRPKYADDEFSKKLFGQDPNHDLLKALQVSDAFLPPEQRKPGAGLFLANTVPLTKKGPDNAVPVEMECLKKKLNFQGSLKIDETLLTPEAESRLGFGKKKTYLSDLLKVLKTHSQQRLDALITWYAKMPDCERILKMLTTLRGSPVLAAPETALIQLGAGTGWDGNTFGSALKNDPVWFESLLKAYQIRRITKNQTAFPSDGFFPASRKVVLDAGGRPEAPLGLCLLLLKEKNI